MQADPISTTLLICDTVIIEEKTSIPSAIKIIDVYNIPESYNALPEEQRAISVSVLYIVTFPPEDDSEHEAILFLNRPDLEPVRVGAAHIPKLTSKFPGAPKATSLSVRFGVLAKAMGAHYISVILDGRHETKAQFILRPAPRPEVEHE